MKLLGYILLTSLLVPTADSGLRSWQLGEAAKARYRQEDWPAFFGLARYIHLHANELECARHVRALEALARLRHCRWSEAAAIAQEPALTEEAAAIRAFLSLQPSLVEQPAPIAAPAFSRRRWFWQFGDAMKSDPLRWRVVVESLCPEAR